MRRRASSVAKKGIFSQEVTEEREEVSQRPLRAPVQILPRPFSSASIIPASQIRVISFIRTNPWSNRFA